MNITVLLLLLSALALNLMLGSFELSLEEIMQTLFATAPSATADTVIWEFRMPRSLTAALAGALLALSGAIMQNVTRNSLADPSLVGVSQGASFAVVFMTVLFPVSGLIFRPLFAFGGAIMVALAIQSLALTRSNGATMRFILIGIGVAAFVSACTSALITYGNIEQAMAALGWLSGSVHTAGWNEAILLACCIVILVPFLCWASRPMSALRMGPEIATGLGVNVGRTRRILITLSVAPAAFAVAAVGPLGFVGLIAPHMARRLAPAGIGMHLILSALCGATLVACADLCGRVAFLPAQIPAGLVTAIIGVPVFLVLILRNAEHDT